jgi:hypothetical protein
MLNFEKIFLILIINFITIYFITKWLILNHELSFKSMPKKIWKWLCNFLIENNSYFILNYYFYKWKRNILLYLIKRITNLCIIYDKINFNRNKPSYVSIYHKNHIMSQLKIKIKKMTYDFKSKLLKECLKFFLLVMKLKAEIYLFYLKIIWKENTSRKKIEFKIFNYKLI